MNELIIKSAHHVYKIAKVYVAIGVCGVLSVFVIGLILEKPLELLISIGSLAFLMAGILVWVQSHKFTVGLEKRFSRMHLRKPPKLPESIMTIAVPASEREEVIGDLREQFGDLDKKYGRVSATAWYVIQTTLFFLNARLERIAILCVVFFVYLYAMGKLIDSGLAQVLEQLLR